MYWSWLMVLPLILVTFPLVLAIVHLCGILLDTTATTPPKKLHCHLHHIISQRSLSSLSSNVRIGLELKYFRNAYNWVLICIWASHYQWSDRRVITPNISRRSEISDIYTQTGELTIAFITSLSFLNCHKN